MKKDESTQQSVGPTPLSKEEVLQIIDKQVAMLTELETAPHSAPPVCRKVKHCWWSHCYRRIWMWLHRKRKK